MLIALTMTLLFGGGSPDPLFAKRTRTAIKQIVTDDARQAEILAAVKSIEGSWKGANKAAKAPGKELGRLEKDRAALTDDIEAQIDEIVVIRENLHKDFVDGIFEMRENMTEEEWQEVFSPGS
jgi:hypothetical protein